MNEALRAMLFIPGGDERKLAKIPQLGAGSFILDLEDAVAEDAKEQARVLVAAAVHEYGGDRTLFVRVNGVGSGLAEGDLAAVVVPGLAGIVLAKTRTPADVERIDGLLEELEQGRGLPAGTVTVIPTIEDAAALEHAAEIGTASGRVLCLGFGAGDLAAELGIEWPSADGSLNPTLVAAKARLVLASAAAGLEPPHDGASALIDDLDALRREAEQARQLGFGGKHAIHPAQLPIIEQAFTIGADELARDRALVEAFDRGGGGAVRGGGGLVDAPIARRARKRLAVSEPELPLGGLRVLDLSSLYAAPLISTNLADFGADVVKVEHPRGDDARRWGLVKNGVPLWWKSVARNKRVIALDLNTEADRATVHHLAAHADVVIENFRPGRMEAWGLGPDDLRAANHGLVYVRVTGFGQTGPYSSQPGFGTLAEAFSGFAYVTGQPDGPPTLPPFGLADGVAGQVGTWATMIALYWRDARAGEGQVIDLSLYEPLFSILGPQLAEFQHLGIVQERQGNRSQRTSPRNAYQTSDGHWVAISGGTQQVADRVLCAIDRADLVGDVRFGDAAARRANADALDALVADWIVSQPLEVVLRRFGDVDAPIAPVYDAAQIRDDPQYRARGSYMDVPDPDLGTVAMPAIVPRLSGTPGAIRHTGPTAIGADG
ncbi:MAG TPA: aldolase/citrate lyase family protein, partial [Gaiellaceae bacterium]|nr:aldolase/citrate lyase family protein [Gaiellaceae bacterium]